MRTGELAAMGGLTTRTIRFYEQAGLLPGPPRTSAGYRDYPPGTLTRLAFIRDAQTAGLTLAEIRGILAIRDAGQAPCQHVTKLIDRHLSDVEQRITELRHARAALRELRHRATATDPADCGDAAICTILTAPGQQVGLTTRENQRAGPARRPRDGSPAARRPAATRPLSSPVLDPMFPEARATRPARVVSPGQDKRGNRDGRLAGRGLARSSEARAGTSNPGAGERGAIFDVTSAPASAGQDWLTSAPGQHHRHCPLIMKSNDSAALSGQ